MIDFFFKGSFTVALRTQVWPHEGKGYSRATD